MANFEGLPIVEIAALCDIYATTVADIEAVGPCVRLVFCVDGPAYAGAHELHAVARIVMPVEVLAALVLAAGVVVRNLPVVVMTAH